MTWAETLATFNFVAWLLPIIIRTWMAWKYGSNNTIVLGTEERDSIGRAVLGLNLRGKKFKIGSGTEKP